MRGISINDLRKNLRDLNEHMDQRVPASAAARYGIVLDASLITGIDPPPEVESALAAINTAHNQVSSRDQPGAGRGRPEDRAVEARGGDRDAEGAGRGRAAAGRWPTQLGDAQGERRHGGARGLRAQRAPRPAEQGRSRSTWRCADDRLSSCRAARSRSSCFLIGVPLFLGFAALPRPLHDRRGAPLPRLRAVRQGGRHHRRAGPALPAVARWAWRRSSCTGSAGATSSTCGSTRSTCAASRSTPRKARRWASASGTRCSSRDPVAYLFKNADPRGSLRANVSNATVRCLCNMPLARHAGEPPRHEPDGARRGLAEVAASGATSSARSTSARSTSATPA